MKNTRVVLLVKLLCFTNFMNVIIFIIMSYNDISVYKSGHEMDKHAEFIEMTNLSC